MRVVVAEDSGLVRDGIVRLLEDAGLDVVAAVGTAGALLRAVEQHQPEAVITDIRMPPTQTNEGLQAAIQIRETYPGTGVLVLSQHAQPGYAVELLQSGSGGLGYLLKDRVSDVETLIGALQRVSAGGTAIDPEVVTLLLRKPRVDEGIARLSERELQILALMAEGKSNSAICEAVTLSPKTVETHISRIFTKLDLQPTTEEHRRVLAVLRYLRGAMPDPSA